MPSRFTTQMYLNHHRRKSKSHARNHCGSRFRNQRYLKLYMSVQSSVKDFRCDACNRLFKYASTLLTRIQRKHVKSAADAMHKCNVCFKYFKHQRSLHKHNKIHTGEGRISCKFCQKEIRSDRLKRHLLVHADHYPLECLLCNRRFRYLSSLNKACNQISH